MCTLVASLFAHLHTQTRLMVTFVGSAIPGDRDGFKMNIEFFV